MWVAGPWGRGPVGGGRWSRGGGGEARVEASPAEDAEGEGGKYASFLVLPKFVGGFYGVAVVGEVVVC